MVAMDRASRQRRSTVNRRCSGGREAREEKTEECWRPKGVTAVWPPKTSLPARLCDAVLQQSHDDRHEIGLADGAGQYFFEMRIERRELFGAHGLFVGLQDDRCARFVVLDVIIVYLSKQMIDFGKIKIAIAYNDVKCDNLTYCDGFGPGFCLNNFTLVFLQERHDMRCQGLALVSPKNVFLHTQENVTGAFGSDQLWYEEQIQTRREAFPVIPFS
ncbi:MAG: hypothetical protein ACLGQH_02550 [Acidobacteriota bacterium]